MFQRYFFLTRTHTSHPLASAQASRMGQAVHKGPLGVSVTVALARPAVPSSASFAVPRSGFDVMRSRHGAPQLLMPKFTSLSDLRRGFRDGDVAWFADGEINACYNCVDRWFYEKPDAVRLMTISNDASGACRAFLLS
jgi:hypothetical protein